MRTGTHWRLFAGPLTTLLALAGLQAVARADLRAEPSYAVLAVALVAHAAFLGGVLPGLLSQALVLAHAALPLVLGESSRADLEALSPLGVLSVGGAVIALLVGTLQRRAARAAELARVNEELVGRVIEQHRAEEAAKALAALGRALVQPLDFASVRHHVVTIVLELFHVTRAVLYDLDPSSNTLVCVATAGRVDSAQWLGRALPRGAGVAWAAVTQACTIWAPDVSGPEFNPPDWLRARYTLEGVRSVVALPLKSRGRILGVLSAGVVEGRMFTPGEHQLLSIFADSAALALENTRLYADLRAALDRLTTAQEQRIDAERLKALQELMAGLAHHVNNRLMVILAGVQFVSPKVGDVGLRRSLELVERTALDSARLVDKLRHFSEARPVASSISADLNMAVQQAVAMARQYQLEAESRGIDVRVEPILAAVPRITADQALLEEALVNVLANAIEALERPGTVAVRTWAAGHDVYCSVEDSGPGMPEETRRRAAEPFFTTKGPQRTGLGLSIAHGLMRQQRGSLEIRSTVGSGTLVTLRLPRAPERAEATAGVFVDAPVRVQ